MRFLPIAGAAIAAALVLAGCTAGGDTPVDPVTEPTVGGNLTIAWNAQPTTLDPIATTATTTRDIANNIFEGLFALDADAKAQPMLATGFEVNDDFTEYTIALREGVLFHNGDEMKSADVVASLNRWITSSTIGKQDYASVTVEAVDDYSVKLTSPEPFFTMIELMMPPNQGLIIVPEESVAAVTETGMPEEAIIGTGPYKFVEWTKDQAITLERFDDYQGVDAEPSGLSGAKHAYLDTLTFEFVPDVTTRVNGLQTGEYDFASAVPADNLAQLESAGLVMSTEFIYQFLFVTNKASGFFASEEARQALFYAIEPSAILTSAYGGADFFELNGSISKPSQTNWFTDEGIVDDGDIDISPLIQTTGDQTVQVASGASLTLPSEFDVISDTVTFDVAEDGLVTFGPASRLDGIGGAGEVVKTGLGTLVVGGGTGEIGGGGLQVQDGWLHATGDLTGTRVFIDGGSVSGGSVGNPALGVIQRLAVGDGTVSPGTAIGGGDIATLWVWDEFSANNTAVLALQLDGTDSDVVNALNGVNVQDATLELTLTDAPAIGTTWDIVVQQNDGVFTAFYQTSAGDPILEGVPFVEDGQRYSLETVSGDGGSATVLTYLGVAPQVVTPPTTAPALPATGIDAAVPLAIAGLLVALGGILLLRRRTA